MGFRTVDYFNERFGGDTGCDTKFDNLRRKLLNGRRRRRRRRAHNYTIRRHSAGLTVVRVYRGSRKSFT